MKIEKSKLQEALRIVEPGLAEKEIPYLEQSKSFAFVGGKIITYNDEISISHPIEGWGDIEGVIQAKKLYDLLSKLSAKELDIFINKKSEMIIKAGKAKAGLTLQSELNLPIIEFTDDSKWMKLPDNFIDAIIFTSGCASTDSGDPILQNLHINADGFVESSDSFRIAKYTLSEVIDTETFLIPSKSAIEMTKIKPVEFCKDDAWVHFRTEAGTVFSCRIVNETFPDTTPHLNIKGSQLTFSDKLKEVVDRAMIFAERKNKFNEIITVSAKPGNLKVRSEAESGWFEEDIEMEYDGDEISFIATPFLLKDILSQTTTCVINKERSKLKFEGDNWQYMVALRVQQ